jgi:hypothetical protein
MRNIKSLEWGNELYRETVPFSLMRFLGMMELALGALFLIILAFQVRESPLGNHRTPDWALLALSALFWSLGILFIRMRQMTVRGTTAGLEVTAGPLRYSIPWDRVQSYRLDRRSGIRYGGWGIRIAVTDRRLTLVYSVPGYPRLMLDLNRGMFRRFGFSTTQPEALMNTLRQQTGLGPAS